MRRLESDVMAEWAAQAMLFDLLQPPPTGRNTTLPITDPQVAAQRVVSLFAVQWERRDGLRRLVLRGPVEVDPLWPTPGTHQPAR